MKNKVSIVIPTYNRKDLLERLCNTIKEQTYQNKEIIIIDDCSNQDLSAVLKQYFKTLDIIYKKNSRNIYAEKSRKVGYELSSGKYIIFCDDDDFYTDSYFIEKAINILDKNKNIAFVSANANIFHQSNGISESYKLNISGEINGLDYLLGFQTKYKKPLSTFTTVFRRECFDSNTVFFNDSTLFLWALLFGNAFLIKDIAGNYTIHTQNISNNIKKGFIKEVSNSKHEIYKELIKRKQKNSIDWFTKQIIITYNYYFYSYNIKNAEIINSVMDINKRYPIKKSNLIMFMIKSLIKNSIKVQ